MDCQDYITEAPGRKRGQHLQPEQRGAAVYKADRKHSHKPRKIALCAEYINWVVVQFHEHDRSLVQQCEIIID